MRMKYSIQATFLLALVAQRETSLELSLNAAVTVQKLAALSQ
jgi:hypothetical protein